eukprot:12040625-Alexandrium_andersonii.AAC.2
MSAFSSRSQQQRFAVAAHCSASVRPWHASLKLEYPEHSVLKYRSMAFWSALFCGPASFQNTAFPPP